MPALNKIYIGLVVLGTLLLFACKKDVEQKEVIDNVIYQVDTTRLYSSSAEKTKQKTPTQYISIMYSDIFNSNISSRELSELSELSLALGDKQLANEMTLSTYLKSASASIPSDPEMRADVEAFVEKTYLRFYQRDPQPYEKIYMVQLIEDDPDLKVVDVYTSFILSNEYYHY